MVDSKFIKNLQGKEFILFEGLLSMFHDNGGKEIRTEIISTNPLIIQATASGEKGIFQGIGDADESNTNSMVAKHKIRMAETRAIARSLRWYNNIGMCSIDELGGDDKPTLAIPEETVKSGEFGSDIEVPNICYTCGEGVTDKVKKFSIKTYEKVLCFKCQKKEQKNEV